MRPFDATLAKNGNPVVINSLEQEVKDFTWLPSMNKFIGTVNGIFYSWDVSGHCVPIKDEIAPVFKLYMKPQKIEKFIVIYLPTLEVASRILYDTEEEAFDSIKTIRRLMSELYSHKDFGTNDFTIQKIQIEV